MAKILLTFVCIFQLSTRILSSDEDNLASKIRAERVERIRCGYNLRTLWTAELAHSPFSAAPLIGYITADSNLDVAAAPFSESFTVVDTESGKVLQHKAWPALNLDNSIHSSPIQFDVNGDGLLDLMFTTSSGELLFYTPDGRKLLDYKYHLPPVYVSKTWYKYEVIVTFKDINKYVTFSKEEAKKNEDYIAVDPHIMTTPSLADVNNDGQTEELVLPISYFYEEEDYRLEGQLRSIGVLNITDLERYLLAGVTVLNLTTMETLWSRVLDLTQVGATFPAYNLFPATVFDLDGSGSELEVILGTSAGTVYVFEHKGNILKGWPENVNTIHGQITVADMFGDGSVQLVAVDTDGNVVCFNKDGSRFWETNISGTSSPGSRLFDFNKDGVLDLAIVTNVGDLYALDGRNGSVIEGWPIHLGNKVWSNVLITKVSTTHSVPDLVVTSDDGLMHIISTDLKCRSRIPIGETSLVQVLSGDLVKKSQGLELLVATNDGTLLCLGTGNDLDEEQEEIIETEEHTKNRILAILPSETKSVNDFSYDENKMNLYITENCRSQFEITGDIFDVEFEIIDPMHRRKSMANSYDVKVYFGRNLLRREFFKDPGIKKITVSAWDLPAVGHITVILTNQHGQVFKDAFVLRFNKLIMEDLQWLLLAPFFAMVTLLLVIHGFPAKDLLPYHQTKNR